MRNASRPALFSTIFLWLTIPFLIACAKKRPVCPEGTVALYAGCLGGSESSQKFARLIRVFRAIPFGQSTAGDNRFLPPRPVEPWRGVKELKGFQKTWATEDERRSLVRKIAKETEWGVFPTDDCPQVYPFLGFKIGSEDCLKLNVWTPAAAMEPGAEPLPVMVFIYGGGFYFGGTSPLFFALYDGEHLAATNNVVVVSLNYRLGALGGLPSTENAGNLAILDQQLALAWVRDEIEQFGGDPGKVTIFGESAGGISVAAHSVSAPASKGLFRAAIVESDPFALPFPGVKEKQTIKGVYLDLLGCKDLSCARGKSLRKILDAQMDMPRPEWWPDLASVFYWMPTVDGDVLTEPPITAVAGQSTPPMILGTNENEGTYFVQREIQFSGPYTGDRYTRLIKQLFGADANSILARYEPRPDSSNVLSRLMGDYLFVCGTRGFAGKAVAAGNADLFTYRFSKISAINIDGLLGIEKCQFQACHAAELPYVFQYEPLLMPLDGETLLSRAMQEYWGGLAKNLQPASSLPGTPAWPAWSTNDLSYQNLNTPVTVEDDPYKDTCAFWDGIGYDRVFPVSR